MPEPSGPSVVQVRAAGVNFMDVLIRRGDYPQPPENGHFVGLSMHITTAPNLPANSFVDINATDFSFIGSGQQYVGTLVLDVPETTGILQYQPLYLSAGGWEWHF